MTRTEAIERINARQNAANLFTNIGEAEIEAEMKKEETAMLTVEKIAAMILENGFKDITVTCPDGVEAVITPCFYGSEPPAKVSDCEYFLVYCDLPWLGDSKLEKVVSDLNSHADLVARDEAEKKELRAYFEAGEADGWTKHDFGWYSDWHKDLYGYRPHGHVCGEYVRPY